ncbi:zinc finger protein 184-like isoform X2 [Epinephelus fuscoguttatus]|uniref:zinc finger protein 184-like isoform X2 n=1 Tax=Epinephelus fuscoguttatus TaxID=293821 RepID=UPI0020D0483F|nr:zinc finger protein 184-like isoform X2 [Epinephelus fuscoguttatus]
MCKVQMLRALVKQRLTAAAEEIFGLFERTIAEYEEQLCRSKEENERQRKLLDAVYNPQLRLHRAEVQQQLLVVKEEVPPEQQEWSSSVDQEDPEPPHIKEEEEELWSSQEGEQLQGLEEADITKFTFTPVPVKSEDDEEKPQSEGHHCGGPGPPPGPGPDRNSHPDSEDKTSDSSEAETETDWRDRKPFRCSVCAKTFKHRGNLNMHMRTHTGVKPFSCSLCGKRFTQKPGLDYHLKTHTGEKPFSCSVCGKTFRHKGAVTYHMATHTGVKPFSCGVCGKRFRRTSQLKAHRCVSEYSRLRRGDERKTPLNCSECNATFPNNYLLVMHMRMHKGKKLFTCSVCGQKRQFSSHLEIHMRTHTGEKPFSCSVCGKTFSQRGIMSQHMAVHSGVKPFSCGVCGRRFFWHFQIKKHKCLGESLQRRRAGFNGEGCREPEPACSDPQPDTDKDTRPSPKTDDNVDIEFWKETRQHQSGFTYGRTKKVSVNDGCSDNKAENKLGEVGSDFCRPPQNYVKTEGKTVTKTGSNNTYEKSFSCSDNRTETKPGIVSSNFCGQPQNNVKTDVSVGETVSNNTDKKLFGSFESHERSEDSHTPPTNRKPFSCLSCGKGFASGGHLTRHISVHTGEKLLSCVICEKRFTLESQLLSHQCAADSPQPHAANRLLISSQCGKGSNRKHNLQVPMRIHTGLKPFGCSVCGRTFAKRENLRSHMMCHRGDKPFCCSVCNAGFIDSEALVQHMRIHTRQTQFTCLVCGKEFAWRRYLTKHMEVHTKERIYSCRYCDQNFLWHHQLKYHRCAAQSSTDRYQGQADGEDCGGPEPAKNSDPDLRPDTDDMPEDSSETETDDSDCWNENSGCLKPKVLQNHEIFNNRRPKICSRNPEAGKPFSGSLSQNMAACTGKRGMLENQEPQHIKEEQEELLEGGHLYGLEAADVTKFLPTSVPVKIEDDEEKPQSSQLHQTQADGEDCGRPEPAENSDTDDSVNSDFWKETRKGPSGAKLSKVRAELESDGSVDSVDSDFWKDDMKPQPGSNSPNDSEIPQSDPGYNALRRAHSCPECGKRFLHDCNLKNHMKYHTGEKAFFCPICGLKCLYRSHLEIHMRTHTGEKPFPCPVCGKKYAHKASMQSHMVVHTEETKYSCSVCDRGFAWYTELKYHQCVGESSQEDLHRRETI